MSFFSLLAATLGLALVVALSLVLARAVQRDKLLHQRAGDESFADLLPYALMAAPGVVWTKGDQLLAGWEVTFPDIGVATTGERNRTAQTINSAMVSLGGGWTLNVGAMRKQAPKYGRQSRWPDPITAMIDEERRNLFEAFDTMYEGTTVLTVTYTPPSVMQSKLVNQMFEDEGRAQTTSLAMQEVQKFERELRALESRLSSVMTMRRLGPQTKTTVQGDEVTHDDLLQWLHYCTTGLWHPIGLPSTPVFLDLLVGGQELWPGEVSKIGKKFMKVLTLEGFPLESWPGMFQDLAELPCEYRFASRGILIDRMDAEKSLEKLSAGWQQRVIGLKDQLTQKAGAKQDRNAKSMVDEASEALKDIRSGNVAAVYYTNALVIWDEDRDRLDAAVEMARRLATSIGMQNVREETVGALDAFLGTLPGDTFHNVRRPVVYSLNFAHFLPTSTIWPGAVRSPCSYFPPGSDPVLHGVTKGSTPFRLNLHSSAMPDNGHTLVFGPTRAGKSALLGLLAAQLQRYPRLRTFFFDNGESVYTLTKAMGASAGDGSVVHFGLSPDAGDLSFAPLKDLSQQSHIDWASDWIDMILGLAGVKPTPSQRNEITGAIASLAANGGGTMTELRTLVQDAEIREVLRDYTVEGNRGYLLDGEDDHLQLGRFSTFELSKLMTLSERFALPVLWYLIQVVERSLTGDPAVIIIDEAWLLLKSPAFSAQLEKWLRTLGKKNCFVIMATQSLEDLASSAAFDVMLNSCPTRIFLPNANAGGRDAKALYKRFGLNDQQVEIVRTAQSKREYFFMSPDGLRKFELALGPVALALCATSKADEVKEVKALEHEYGADWVPEWVRRRTLRMKGAA